QPEAERPRPGAADLEEFPALSAEPDPEWAEPLQKPRPFAEQATDGDDENGDEQQVGGAPLARRRAAAEHPRDEQRARDIGAGDPEDGELQMPSAQEVAGQKDGEVDAVEAAGIGAVGGDAAADQGL